VAVVIPPLAPEGRFAHPTGPPGGELSLRVQAPNRQRPMPSMRVEPIPDDEIVTMMSPLL